MVHATFAIIIYPVFMQLCGWFELCWCVCFLLTVVVSVLKTGFIVRLVAWAEDVRVCLPAFVGELVSVVSRWSMLVVTCPRCVHIVLLHCLVVARSACVNLFMMQLTDLVCDAWPLLCNSTSIISLLVSNYAAWYGMFVCEQFTQSCYVKVGQRGIILMTNSVVVTTP